MEELGKKVKMLQKIPKKNVGEKMLGKMLEQFSTALPTISTFHKNVEKILKRRKILSNIFKNKILSNIFKNVDKK
jgi:hypothetical protein